MSPSPSSSTPLVQSSFGGGGWQLGSFAQSESLQSASPSPSSSIVLVQSSGGRGAGVGGVPAGPQRPPKFTSAVHTSPPRQSASVAHSLDATHSLAEQVPPRAALSAVV